MQEQEDALMNASMMYAHGVCKITRAYSYREILTITDSIYTSLHIYLLLGLEWLKAAFQRAK